MESEPGMTWMGAVLILLDGTELFQGRGEKGARDAQNVLRGGILLTAPLSTLSGIQESCSTS